MRLILASSSFTRQKILKEACIDFVSVPSDIDETPIHINEQMSVEEKARILSREKAQCVSKLYPDDLIIGADQALDMDGKIMTKAQNKHQAREQLKQLRGKTHKLPTAVCMVKNSSLVWDYLETPRLTMRNFGDDFLENYLNTIQKDSLTVGCYQIEGRGIQLFSNIDGNHYTIMGLPLLPLITELQRWNIT